MNRFVSCRENQTHHTVVSCRKNRTHRSRVVSCRENHRRPFTLILGSARVQNWHQTGTQRELKNPTPTFTFLFILSSARPLLQYALSLFYQRTGSVYPFECAALTSIMCSKCTHGIPFSEPFLDVKEILLGHLDLDG